MPFAPSDPDVPIAAFQVYIRHPDLCVETFQLLGWEFEAGVTSSTLCSLALHSANRESVITPRKSTHRAALTLSQPLLPRTKPPKETASCSRKKGKLSEKLLNEKEGSAAASKKGSRRRSRHPAHGRYHDLTRRLRLTHWVKCMHYKGIHDLLRKLQVEHASGDRKGQPINGASGAIML